MIVFCHKWLHQFDQEDNYKIKIVRRAAACVFSDRVIYCSLERLSFALPLTRLPLPSIYNCSIKILTLLPIGWILFHRSYRIKFYHFTVVSFLLYHCIRKWANADKFALTLLKWQKWLLFARLLKLWIKDPAVFRGKVLAAQFVNAFTWQFIRGTPALDNTSRQKRRNILGKITKRISDRK